VEGLGFAILVPSLNFWALCPSLSPGEHFRALGYAVSTVGFELDQIRRYIREQEEADGTDGQF
jgi:hypothetical protein